jgi:enamine deaminase RidA (YjgF/YER057c/UK114 family)
MIPIERIPGNVPTRSWGSAYRELVWALGMSDDFSLDFAGQAARAFAALDTGLAQAGTNKTRLISVQVYLEEIEILATAIRTEPNWTPVDDH